MISKEKILFLFDELEQIKKNLQKKCLSIFSKEHKRWFVEKDYLMTGLYNIE